MKTSEIIVPTHPLPLTKRPAAKLPSPSEWSFELLALYNEVIAQTAQRFGLDTYPNQFEIITSEQMMDAYASVGMPVNYRHWSYGKQFIATEQQYRRGQMGLAYEIVINSSPCISYLMEENTMAMQALVMAHAAYGHNSFFKGNYLFRQWTDATGIVDYLVYAKEFIARCEEQHGLAAVEALLDSCHALANYGVDRYRHPPKLSLADEESRRKERQAYAQAHVDELWRVVAPDRHEEKVEGAKRFPEEPEENILYFLEKNAPLLRPWEREVIRIVRKIAQYFYPQRQTQVMNEGWATFWHHHLLNTMYDDGYLDDGMMIEFLKSHTNVVYQPPVTRKGYSGINPYALGFAMYTDIKRICEGGVPDPGHPGKIIPSSAEQLAEDREWFPQIAGTPWLPALHGAMRDSKDESFIQQYLSPHLMRQFRLFSIIDDEKEPELVVEAIHNDTGYRKVRETLSFQYNLNEREPNIQVWSVDARGDRTLTLRHMRTDDRPLHESGREVVKHVAQLWGFTVRLESLDEKNRVEQEFECSPPRSADD